jgi:murein DD-endopeptidase MepM/ murein hydrolase activator NlpD
VRLALALATLVLAAEADAQAPAPAGGSDDAAGGTEPAAGAASGDETSGDGSDRGTSDGEPRRLSHGPLVPPSFEEDDDTRCERRDGIRYAACDGPRRVAVPSEEARERAERLGLGTHAAADLAYVGTPPAEWVTEAGERHEGLLWPVATGLFSRGYGAGRVHETSRGHHEGIDVVQAEGAHLRAVDDALVVYADNGVRGLGNVLFLVLADGTVALYAHCRALWVAAGERVHRGQIVGELGATGLTVRAHLHFEWRLRGRTRDPMPEMRERPEWIVRDEVDGEPSWRAIPPNRREATPPEAASSPSP